MARIVVSLTTGVAVASLIAVGALAIENPIESLLNDLGGVLNSGMTTADSAAILGDAAILRIIDRHEYRARISDRTILKRATLERIFDRHQSSHPHEWNTAQDGLLFAAEFYGAQIWQTPNNISWPFFVRFGEPTVWWVEPYEVSFLGSTYDTVPMFFFWWESPDTGIACQGDSTTSRYPTHFADTFEPDSRHGEPMYPAIDVVCFMEQTEEQNPDTTYDVWVVTAVNGDEITASTIQQNILTAEFEIKDRDGHVDLRESQSHSLRLPGLALSVTENRGGFDFPFYYHAGPMRSGVYDLQVRVTGDRMNAGKTKRRFSILSPLSSVGMSDIVIADPHPPQGRGLASRVRRHGRDLAAIARPAFRPGDTISLYAELYMPNESEWAYLVKVFLDPVRSKGTPKHAVTQTQLLPSADSTGSPIAAWAGVDVRRRMQELLKQTEPGITGFNLLQAKVGRPDTTSPIGILETALEVQPDAPSVDHWLKIVIEGHNERGERFFATSQKRIKIRGPVTLDLLPGHHRAH